MQRSINNGYPDQNISWNKVATIVSISYSAIHQSSHTIHAPLNGMSVGDETDALSAHLSHMSVEHMSVEDNSICDPVNMSVSSGQGRGLCLSTGETDVQCSI